MVPIRALAQAKLVQGPQVGHPLQRLPRRRHQRRAQARLQLRPGAGRHGADLGHDPAAGLRLRMDRHRACRKRRRPARPASCSGWRSCSPISSWWRSTRAGTFPLPVLLSVSVGVLGAIAGVAAGRPGLRRLCPDRPGRAGGARRQERHPDRRVRRRAAARTARRSSTSAHRGRATALPPGDDDELRLHPRPAAAGHRRRRRRRSAAARSARRCSAA